MEEKRYILESDKDTISIINMECGMRDVIAKTELSAETIEFFERLKLLISKELIGTKTKKRA